MFYYGSGAGAEVGVWSVCRDGGIGGGGGGVTTEYANLSDLLL